MILVSISDALSNGINRYHENVHNNHLYRLAIHNLIYYHTKRMNMYITSFDHDSG